MSLQSDFCWSLNFAPVFLAQLVYEGFLPICADLGGDTGLWLLMPKWHVERCTMAFSDVHVAKSARKVLPPALGQCKWLVREPLSSSAVKVCGTHRSVHGAC